jgi:hypothetical protein
LQVGGARALRSADVEGTAHVTTQSLDHRPTLIYSHAHEINTNRYLQAPK